MPPAQEVDEVAAWCRARLNERGVVAAVERNPFQERFPWLRSHPLIEINRPRAIASRMSLVYDNATNALWECVGGMWRTVPRE